MSDFLTTNLSLDEILSGGKDKPKPGILAPGEVFKKLAGSKSKKPMKLVEDAPKRMGDDRVAYIWNPKLEHQFKPVRNLQESMQQFFKKSTDKKKGSSSSKTVASTGKNTTQTTSRDTKKHRQNSKKPQKSQEHQERERLEKVEKRKQLKQLQEDSDMESSEEEGEFYESGSENENSVLKNELVQASSDDEDAVSDVSEEENASFRREVYGEEDEGEFDQISEDMEDGEDEGEFDQDLEEQDSAENSEAEDSEAEDTEASGYTLTEEDIKSIRKHYSMHISSSTGGLGSDRLTRKENLKGIPAPAIEWEQLKIPDFLLENIRKRGYEQLTPVQMQGIPIMSKLNKDFVCIAPTGTGKTLTFLLPLLHRITPCKLDKNKDTSHVYPFRALIVSPTKVLASQIYEDFRFFTKGGSWKVRQLGHSKESTKSSRFNDILISTPKRLAMAIKEGDIDLSSIEYLIFDEADKLFESGYLNQIDEIITACSHSNIVKAMFSATMPLGVEQMINTIMNDYVRLIIGKKNAGSSNIDQKIEFVGDDYGKMNALKSLVRSGIKVPILIFVQSKTRAQDLYNQLTLNFSETTFPVDVLHSSKSNTENMKIVHQFEEGRIWALIATDVAARGIDFKDVSTVINYDFPYDMMTYIHRIGRTGRAEKSGTSITYVTHTDLPALRSIAEVVKKSGCHVDEWMLKAKTDEKLIERRKIVPPSRASILGRDVKSSGASSGKRSKRNKRAKRGSTTENGKSQSKNNKKRGESGNKRKREQNNQQSNKKRRMNS